MREDRKRLLLVAPSLTGGGGERVAATLCQAFADSEGLDVILVVFDAGSAANLGPRVRVRYIAVRERGGAVYTMAKFFKVVLALSLIIRQERPAAILSFMDYCNTVTLLANRLAGGRSRAVISVHTLLSAFLQGKGADVRGRLLKLLADRLYRQADTVVTVSRGVAADLVSTFALPESKISVIGNPIDLHRIGALAAEDVQESVFIEGGPIVLSVGRLAPEKGGRHLVRAFSHVREQIDANLVFLGEGPEKAELQCLCAELGIEQKVFFLGHRENPFVYMAKSTVFALSSLYEGFGNVLIEAMACGLPVVSTRCYPGIETLIRDGKTGLLVDVGNERALADAVIRLLADSGLRHELSSQAQKEVWRYDVREITARYQSVLFPAAPIEGGVMKTEEKS